MKHDCVFGDDLDVNEISFVSEVSNRALSLSLSLNSVIIVDIVGGFTYAGSQGT